MSHPTIGGHESRVVQPYGSPVMSIAKDRGVTSDESSNDKAVTSYESSNNKGGHESCNRLTKRGVAIHESSNDEGVASHKSFNHRAGK